MWHESALSWPSRAQTIQTQAESVTEKIGSTMSEALGRLSSIQSDAQFGRHPLSPDAEALLGLRGELESLLSTGTVLTVSPYQFNVGTKLESGSYLNPQTAVNVLSAKLRDFADKYRPTGHVHCVAVMATASQLSPFATKLTQLTQVLPLPDWCQVARQANALTTNEVDKFHQPASIKQPRFKPMAHINANPLRSVLAEQGAQIATLESLADDATDVIGKLQALAAKRETKLSGIKGQIDALKNVQGSVYSFSMSGNTESLATQLSQAGAPNKHPLTVASLLLSAEPMPFLETLLGG
ncbi:hypothetical protein ACFSJQ_18415 [Vibrio olivae]|uniref:Uncharacterized protein n=1 Tax=Vibrio olivae TaxID=1243002 RepID=A0ABV5HP35_9VIBR